MATTRGRAYTRAQDARAYARAHRLITVVLGHRPDASDDVAPGQDWVDRMVRAYSVDRAHGRSWDYSPARPADTRAATDAAEQLAEAGLTFNPRNTLQGTYRGSP
jgi:hypothetical protein